MMNSLFIGIACIVLLAIMIYEMVKTLSEEKLMAAYYDGKITEQQLDTMFPVAVSWALWTRK
jgi:hypothetical protein